MIITFVVLVLMKKGQPALLYLVPCTLITASVVAWSRKEMKKFWKGSNYQVCAYTLYSTGRYAVAQIANLSVSEIYVIPGCPELFLFTPVGICLLWHGFLVPTASGCRSPVMLPWQDIGNAERCIMHSDTINAMRDATMSNKCWTLKLTVKLIVRDLRFWNENMCSFPHQLGTHVRL